MFTTTKVEESKFKIGKTKFNTVKKRRVTDEADINARQHNIHSTGQNSDINSNSKHNASIQLHYFFPDPTKNVSHSALFSIPILQNVHFFFLSEILLLPVSVSSLFYFIAYFNGLFNYFFYSFLVHWPFGLIFFWNPALFGW